MKRKTVMTEFLCPECGSITPIHRIVMHERKLAHIKDLYCFNCKTITKQIELKNSDILRAKLSLTENRTPEEEYLYNLLEKNQERFKSR